MFDAELVGLAAELYCALAEFDADAQEFAGIL